MTTVGIRDLARRASAIVRGVRETGEPAIVTDRGRPVCVLYPIDADGLEDYVLANAPEFVTSFREADEDLAAGRTVSLVVRHRSPERISTPARRRSRE